MSEATPATRSKIQRRRPPPQWRQINFPTRGISRLSPPRPRRPVRERARDAWDRVRAFIRSPTLWALVAASMFAVAWYVPAVLAALLSALFFLFRPHFKPIVCRLDLEFGTDSAEFLSTLAGATGVPILAGNRLAILNNGAEFYPAMLDAIGRAAYTITMEQYIFSAGFRFCETAKIQCHEIDTIMVPPGCQVEKLACFHTCNV
ncbi:MAG: hypothetical protein HY235_23920 [Acidobacteria bacterium]|nr:hypothetical protein [Acidobacteriota bacterium]